MKTYIVFVDGIQQDETIKAVDQDDALKQAKAKYPAKWVVSVYLETF